MCFNITCMMFCMAKQLLLQTKQSPTGGVITHVLLFKQVLVFDMVLKERNERKRVNSTPNFV